MANSPIDAPTARRSPRESVLSLVRVKRGLVEVGPDAAELAVLDPDDVDADEGVALALVVDQDRLPFEGGLVAGGDLVDDPALQSGEAGRRVLVEGADLGVAPQEATGRRELGVRVVVGHHGVEIAGAL